MDTHDDYFDFRIPDLAALDPVPTDNEQRLARAYTRIRRIVVEGFPDAHTSWLVVEQQQFRLSHYLDTEEEAIATCLMIAKALEHLLILEGKP